MEQNKIYWYQAIFVLFIVLLVSFVYIQDVNAFNVKKIDTINDHTVLVNLLLLEFKDSDIAKQTAYSIENAQAITARLDILISEIQKR